MITVTSQVSLNEKDIHFDFIRASGPGGQNVNKVATAVQLRFDLSNTDSFSEETKKRLIKLYPNRITEKGEILIEARRYRTQERNRQDALERLIVLIQKALTKPKKRYKTKPTQGSIDKRLRDKRYRGETKQNRKNIALNSDD